MVRLSAASFVLAASVIHASPVLTERGFENAIDNDPYTLPKFDRNPRARAAAIEVKRKGWLYSEYPMGVAYYPTGTLANQTIAKDQESWLPPLLDLEAAIGQEIDLALDAIKSVRFRPPEKCTCSQTNLLCRKAASTNWKTMPIYTAANGRRPFPMAPSRVC